MGSRRCWPPYQLASAGDEAVHLAVEGDVVDDLAAVALKVVPKSWMSTPEMRAMIQLAQREGMRRRMRLSARWERQPLTTS